MNLVQNTNVEIKYQYYIKSSNMWSVRCYKTKMVDKIMSIEMDMWSNTN